MYNNNNNMEDYPVIKEYIVVLKVDHLEDSIVFKAYGVDEQQARINFLWLCNSYINSSSTERSKKHWEAILDSFNNNGIMYENLDFKGIRMV